MSRIHSLLDPEARATIEAVFAKWAAWDVRSGR
ncbi:MAG: hypothetical protein QOC63_5396 [Mycobacterium sp.]|jgi:hypothetical protein|nr:hypothetical protein [Mycobacterium sp.]